MKTKNVWGIVACTLACLTVSHADLVGYWNFENITGGVTADSIGGNNGTLQSTTTVLPIAGPAAIGGNGVQFDGSADSWISTDATPAVLGYTAAGAARTVSFWAQHGAFNDGGFFDQGKTGTGQQNFSVRTVNGTTNLRAQYWGGGDHDYAAPALNTWNHYTLSYDGNVTTAYVNGALASRKVQTTPLDTADDYGVRFGIWRTAKLIGAVDDFSVYNSVLPHESIVELSRGNATPTSVAAFANINTLSGNAPTANGKWAVREIWGNGTIGTLSDGISSLLSGATGGGVVQVDYQMDAVDVHDSGGSGKVAGGTPLQVANEPGGPAAGSIDDLVFVAKAKLQVTTTGVYTLMHTGDDGFMLRIFDENGPLEFDSVSGGAVHVQGGFAFHNPTSVVDRFGVITLAAGDNYGIEYVGFERAGGGTWELHAAPGTKTAFDGDFSLITDDSPFLNIIPEPSSLTLLALGAIALMARRRA